MQDIVYKLVPGLQEGKLQCDLFKGQFAHTSYVKDKRKFQVMKRGAGGEATEKIYSGKQDSFTCVVFSN